jgi:endonuclease-3
MTLNARYEAILGYFESHIPEAETELLYDNPYQLLVAVILSAQCTDKRVNLTTPALFEAFPDIDTLAVSTPETVFPFIRSISYPNNKAKHLVGMAQRVRDAYSGNIPMTVAELVTLPGVGRKTANVITSVIDQQPNMAVDTHVFRVSARLGLTRGAKTPLQTEQQLIKHIPKNKVHIAHHWLILHGRYTCIARQPKCETCGLQAWCAFYTKATNKAKSKSLGGRVAKTK